MPPFGMLGGDPWCGHPTHTDTSQPIGTQRDWWEQETRRWRGLGSSGGRNWGALCHEGREEEKKESRRGREQQKALSDPSRAGKGKGEGGGSACSQGAVPH